MVTALGEAASADAVLVTVRVPASVIPPVPPVGVKLTENEVGVGPGTKPLQPGAALKLNMTGTVVELTA